MAARLKVPLMLTTSALNGVFLGPDLPSPRHSLVIHGRQGRSRPAEETWTAREWEPSLRWMGLPPRYLEERALPEDPPHSLPGAIILDPGLELDPERQLMLVSWLDKARRRGCLIIVAGQPFSSEPAWSEFRSRFGCGGSGSPALAGGGRWSLLTGPDAASEPSMAMATPPNPLDLKAPADARILASLRHHPDGAEGTGPRAVFDAAFFASWGALWLPMQSGVRMDPGIFLAGALPAAANAPVPDASTMAGRRVYVSTVQGRGFCQPSRLEGAPLCGEVLRNALLEFPQLPVTAGVAEADLRGWSPGTDPGESMRYETAARSLFALPNVEPACNSFSRPADWSESAFTPGKLRPAVPDTRLGIQRELAGSMAYMHRHLLPVGKSPLFVLWPEGAPPSADAVDFLTGQLGGQHLPDSWREGWHLGGRSRAAAGTLTPTALTRAMSPAGLADQWIAAQTLAPDSGRSAPVHLAYAFADLGEPANLDALLRIWSWCVEANLFPMTASSYSALLRDTAALRVFKQGEGRWLVCGTGRPATLRLRAPDSDLDWARCVGVTGCRRQGDLLFVQIEGPPCCRIVLSQDPAGPSLPHLIEGERLVHFFQRGDNRATLRVAGEDAARITLGGFSPHVRLTVSAGDWASSALSNSDGEVTLALPAKCAVRVHKAAEAPVASR
jgi:hypothetical protein